MDRKERTVDFGRRRALDGIAAAEALPLIGGSPAPTRLQASAEIDFGTWSRINMVVQAYADCMDRLDYDGLANVFTPDGVFDYTPDLIMRGRAAIRDTAANVLVVIARSSHLVGAPTVTHAETPGTYNAVSYFMAKHEWKESGKQQTLHGRYVDAFVPDAATGQLLIGYRKVFAHVGENDSGTHYWLPRE